MSIEKLSTIWPEWNVVEQIGKGSFGKVYKAVRDDHGFTNYAAIKVLTIPQNPSELTSLKADGYNETSARSYFEGIVIDFVNEIKLMVSLKGTANIVNIEDYKVIERVDEIGWDIFIRMELLTSFISYSTNNKLSESEVIKLGQDICSALELCARTGKGIIHRDIKPENIFITSFGDFKLGDFGIARELEKSNNSMSSKGTYNYIAPEVTTSRKYDSTVDIYSLGLVLYKLLNNNRLPFIDPYSDQISYQDHKNAIERRFNGEPIPIPVGASLEMGHVLIKACMHNFSQRFKTATEFKHALENVKNNTYEITQYVTQDLDRTSLLSDIDASVNGRKSSNKKSIDEDIEKSIPIFSSKEENKNESINKTNDFNERRFILNKTAIFITFIVCACLITSVLLLTNYLNRKDVIEEDIKDSHQPEVIETTTPVLPQPARVEVNNEINNNIDNEINNADQLIEVLPELDLAYIVLNTHDWVRLEIQWDSGRVTIFERNNSSIVWTMISAYDDHRLIDPNFTDENGTLIIGFPTTNKRYFLYDDMSGFYGVPGEQEIDYITWSYETDPFHNNGTSFGVYQNYDFIGAVIRYPMVTLYINWPDGRTTIFYKRNDGVWRISSRSEANLLNIAVILYHETDYVLMEFPEGHPPYYLYNDGGGWHEVHGEFNWNYSFSN